jgi:hypothetical protein
MCKWPGALESRVLSFSRSHFLHLKNGNPSDKTLVRIARDGVGGAVCGSQELLFLFRITLWAFKPELRTKRCLYPPHFFGFRFTYKQGGSCTSPPCSFAPAVEDTLPSTHLPISCHLPSGLPFLPSKPLLACKAGCPPEVPAKCKQVSWPPSINRISLQVPGTVPSARTN